MHMKIAIITYSWAQNWGAVLQAYALTKYMNSLGHETKLIDYREFDNKLISTVKSVPDGIADLLMLSAGKRRISRFDDFRHSELNLTKKCNSTDELKTLNKEFDAFITGSDQVWNVGRGVCKDFYLHFAGQDKRRISYAASFGVSQIPDEYIDDTIQGLNNIDYLSVREQSGKEIIKKLTGREAKVVLDPVFLLGKEKWIDMASGRIFSKPYIFVYPTQVSETMVRVVKKIRKDTGYMAVSPFYIPGCKVIKDLGPKEFIRCIHDAAYVVASSFHATAFSLIFNKPLACVTHSQTGARTTDLLSMLGMNGCIVQQADKYSLSAIDYSDANMRMKELLRNSKEFLTQSLR